MAPVFPTIIDSIFQPRGTFIAGRGNWGQTGISIFNLYNHNNIWRRQYQIVDGEMISTDVKYLGLTVSAFVNLNLEKPPADRSLGPAWVKPEPNTTDNRKTPTKPGKEYDFYGTIVAISSDRVTVSTESWDERVHPGP